MQAVMNKSEDSGSRSLLRSSPKLHQRRSLQEANSVSLQLSGNQVQHSKDPHGQILRQLRQAQRLDPSIVATQACISLGQLYELETGGQRLFYSNALRQQAARRVARLLHSDWDAILAGKVHASQGAPAETPVTAPQATGQVIPLRPSIQLVHDSHASEVEHSVERSAAHPPAGTSLLSVPDVANLHDAPPARTHETIAASTPAKPAAAPLPAPTRSHLLWRALLGVLFALAIAAAAWRAGLLGNVLQTL